MRVRHLALIMITLGLGLLLHEVANQAHWLTGGADGLQGVRTWPLLGVFGFDLWGYTAYGYALVVLFLRLPRRPRRLIHSPFGLSLRGIRENATRMPAIGADDRVAHPQASTRSRPRWPAWPARCSRRRPRPCRSRC